MPPVQGSGKAPNISNPNLPTVKKAPSTAGESKKSDDGKKSNDSKKPDESADATTLAISDPAKAIEKLEIKTKAVNANNVARVANAKLTSSDDKLHPLMSLKNGRVLEKFPETSGELAKMTLIQVDNMLGALEADRMGNEAAKREKLRLQIGLKPNPA